MNEILSRHRQFCDFSITFKGLSKSTVKSFRLSFEQYLRHSGISDFRSFTQKSVMEWIGYGRSERNWSPKTTRIKVGDLKMFSEWAISQNLLKTSPTVGIPLPKEHRKEPEFLSEQQADTIMEWVRNYPYQTDFERTRAIAVFAIFLGTGVRRDELRKLRVEDVNLDQCFVSVRQGKGNKDRTIPFHPSLRLVLDRYLEQRKKLKRTCPLFFTSSQNNTGISCKVIARLFRKIRDAAGIRIYPHKMRHTYATIMLSRGLSVYEVKELLGHSSLESTLIYLHVCNQSLRKHVRESGFSV